MYTKKKNSVLVSVQDLVIGYKLTLIYAKFMQIYINDYKLNSSALSFDLT